MGNEKETGRIEAFSDGVLAIVITLLVLELKVPEAKDTTDFSLISELLKQWPTYIAFLVSFTFVLVMWINHHRLFSVIRRSDDYLLILNGLLLLGITLFPFFTGLAADYLQHPQQRTAITIYNALGISNSLFFNVLWRYAAYKNRLLSEHADPALVRTITRQYAFGPFLYGAILVIGLFSGVLSLFCSAAMAIFFALPNRLFTRLIASEEERTV